MPNERMINLTQPESRLKLKPRFLDSECLLHCRLPDHVPPTSNTSPQLPLLVLCGEFQGLCFLGRVMWSRLDLSLVPCCRGSRWLTAQGRGGLTWDVQEREGGSPILAVSGLSSQPLRASPWAISRPCLTCLGAREAAQSGLVRHGLSRPHGCGRGLDWQKRGSCPFSPPLPLHSHSDFCPGLWAWFCALQSQSLGGSHFVSSCLGPPSTFKLLSSQP